MHESSGRVDALVDQRAEIRHEVHPDPGRQRPKPLLPTPRRIQRLIHRTRWDM
jgi:hypothetical protein